jgi:hypothetical protein
VAYSYRNELAAKSINYEDLIRMLADWGIDGLDCTVYWFPDNSNEYLASLRKVAFKNGVQIYNAGVRVTLCQPSPGCNSRNADSGNLRSDGYSQFSSMLPYTTSVHLKTAIAGEDGKKEQAD